MNISVCTIAWRQDRSSYAGPNLAEPFDRLLPRIAAMGYTGVELWLPHVAHMDGPALAGLKRVLDDCRLSVPMISGYYDFTGTADLAAQSMATGRSAIAAARALDARGIRIFTGKRRSSDAGEAGWTQAVDCLRTLADEAGSIVLAAEQHDWNLTDTLEGCERLCRDVGRENMKLIFHPSYVASDPLSAYTRLRPLIAHVHATNPGGTLGTGVIDWRKLVANFHATGYRGWLSVEYFGPDPETLLPQEARFLLATPTEI